MIVDRVSFPFGIGASSLASNSLQATYWAEQQFDIVTLKTVRSHYHPGNQQPTLGFVSDIMKSGLTGELTVTVHDRPSRQPVSMVNSVGIPSLHPDDWTRDIRVAKRFLGSEKLLIASVVGSGYTTNHEIFDDYAHNALLAAEAGADVVEADISCENLYGPSSAIYKIPCQAQRLVERMRTALGNTPLFVKIGYLDYYALRHLLDNIRPYIQGIVAINSLKVNVTSFFPGRNTAGLSGDLLRPYATEVVKNLVELRGSTHDFDIIACGGVLIPEHYNEYKLLGADAVETVTGAMMNSELGRETRIKYHIG